MWEYPLLLLVFLLLLLIYICRWRFFRLPRLRSFSAEEEGGEETADGDTPHLSTLLKPSVKVSIIVPTRNDEERVEYIVSQLLRQHCEERFEVIVADQNSEDGTLDIVRRMEETHANLRHTSVPVSSRYVERRKLAVTLGIRAARGEWCIIVGADTDDVPQTWLSSYLSHLTSGRNFAIAYASYNSEGQPRMSRAVLERVLQLSYTLHRYNRGRVDTCPHSNWAVRKEWFISERGFADSLTLPFGEEAIFAATHVRAVSTALIFSTETKLKAECPSASELTTLRICRKEVRRHLPPHVRLFTRTQFAASVFTYLLAAAIALYAWLRAANIPSATDAYLHTSAVPDAAALLLALTALILPPLWLRHTYKKLGEPHRAAYLYLYEPLRPWFVATTALRHLFMKKNFTRKYI